MLPLPRLAFFAPLIFYPNGTLVPADNYGAEIPDIKVKIASGQKVMLSCYPNFFKALPNEQTFEATCKTDKTLCKLINGISSQ